MMKNISAFDDFSESQENSDCLFHNNFVQKIVKLKEESKTSKKN